MLNSQKLDGSWETYSIMRIPLHSNLEPWKDNRMWRDDIKDQNRLFTTATCLKTLNDYKKIKYSRN